mmetsp:Transcript_25093/g.46049  ORF Transcript_25093/g.46049 Transcript_25093/m.46049 type:complete len:81 (-) Transcript_25093:12-254(-)
MDQKEIDSYGAEHLDMQTLRTTGQLCIMAADHPDRAYHQQRHKLVERSSKELTRSLGDVHGRGHDVVVQVQSSDASEGFC